MRDIYEWRNQRREELRAKLFSSTGHTQTYEEYLNEFPTDEKVWLNYIAHAIALNLAGDPCERIFERAIRLCYVCPDIWMEYIDWKKTTDPSALKDVFKQAIRASGRHWGSGSLIECILDALPPEEHEIRSLISKTCINRMFPHLKHKFAQNSLYLENIAKNRNIFEIKRKYESGNYLTRMKYLEYVTALEAVSVEEAHCIHQRIVFKYNDFPDVWIRYCDFAVKHKLLDDPVTEVIEKCCMELAPWNYMMKFEFLIYASEEFSGLEGISRIFESLISTCWLDLEVIQWIIKTRPTRAHEILSQLIDRFSKSEYRLGSEFLHLMLFRVTHDLKILETILESYAARNIEVLPSIDLVPLCYAMSRLSHEGVKISQQTNVERLLRVNYFQILELGIPKPSPALFPKDDQGRPPPPRAVGKAPPKPKDGDGFHRQEREMKRSLPGYTPGYLAEQYAKKHKL